MSDVSLEVCHDLDAAMLQRILALVDLNTRVDGHSPIGEHKHAHLRVGAHDWSGVLAWRGADLVGYAHAMWGRRPRLRLEVVVHPDVRGDGEVARRLIDAARDVLAAKGGGELWLWVHHVADPHDTLAWRMGFAVQRELSFMTRDLHEPPEVAPASDGIEVRAYHPDTDDHELLRVNNAAFPDHPENGSWDRDDLAGKRALDWFDPDDLLVAWRGDTALGFDWTKWHGHDADDVPAHEPVGEVYVLAVHPDAQGTGLGRHLLGRGLAHLYARGCRVAILYVDRAATGAVALYERAGFSTAHSEVCYSAEVASAPAGSSL